MPSWLRRVLLRIHELAAAGSYRLTYKALWEAESLGFASEDVQDVLVRLGASDFAGRVASRATGEWMYVFKPYVGGEAFGVEALYVKVIMRDGCIVVSFHEDEVGGYEEGEFRD